MNTPSRLASQAPKAPSSHDTLSLENAILKKMVRNQRRLITSHRQQTLAFQSALRARDSRIAHLQEHRSTAQLARATASSSCPFQAALLRARDGQTARLEKKLRLSVRRARREENARLMSIIAEWQEDAARVAEPMDLCAEDDEGQYEPMDLCTEEDEPMHLCVSPWRDRFSHD